MKPKLSENYQFKLQQLKQNDVKITCPRYNRETKISWKLINHLMYMNNIITCKFHPERFFGLLSIVYDTNYVDNYR